MSQRMPFLDNLKVLLTMLVLAHHTAISYGAVGSWAYNEPTESLAALIPLTFFVSFNQSFFMGLFFFISGYFTPSSYHRKGPARFLKERFIRYGIPIALFALFINPLVVYQALVRNEGLRASYLEFWPRSLSYFGIGPLWFLLALLLFSLGYVTWRSFKPLADAEYEQAQPEASRFPGNRAIVLTALALAMVTFIVRLVFPIGEEVAFFQLAFFPQYILLFALGTIAYRSCCITEIPDSTVRLSKIVTAVGVVVWPVVLIGGGALEGSVDQFMGGTSWQALVYAVWESFVGISVSVLLLRLFSKRYNAQTERTKWWSANAYSAYIIHPPVIIGIALLLSGVEMFPLLKFLLVSFVGILTAFAISGYVVRKIPCLRSIL